MQIFHVTGNSDHDERCNLLAGSDFSSTRSHCTPRQGQPAGRVKAHAGLPPGSCSPLINSSIIRSEVCGEFMNIIIITSRPSFPLCSTCFIGCYLHTREGAAFHYASVRALVSKVVVCVVSKCCNVCCVLGVSGVHRVLGMYMLCMSLLGMFMYVAF